MTDAPAYLAFGDLGVDSVAFIDHLPRPDEKLFVEPGGDFSGGMMGNAAATVAALGVSAGVVGQLGTDERGNLVAEELAGRGVDLSSVRRISSPTFWTLSLTTPTGERALVQFPTPAFSADWEGYDRTIVGAAKWIHTTAEQGDPVRELLLESRKTHGVRTSLDIEYPFVQRGDLTELLQMTDVAFVNRAAALSLGGLEEAAKYIQDQGAKIVLVTLGEEGCLLRDLEGIHHRIPAHPADPVDTNGAGDAFAGAFAVANLLGLSDVEGAQMANLVAALATESMGGHGNPPTASRVAQVARNAGYLWAERLS